MQYLDDERGERVKPVEGSGWHQLDLAKLNPQLLQISTQVPPNTRDDHIFDQPRPHCARPGPKTVGSN